MSKSKADRRTIERELQLGIVEQRRINPSFNKYQPLYITQKVYKADTAQMRHNERASNKGRGLKIGHDQELADYIESKIKDEKWSPDVIIGRIKAENIPFKTTICTKTVYSYIDKGIFKEVIRAIRRARRRVGGDFSEVFKTITADNGSEFLDSEAIKKAAKCDEVYYAHPYSSWERGSNENGNRILRRFIPKGVDIGKFTEKELQKIEDWVNNYPRKIHGYKTANEMAAA